MAYRIELLGGLQVAFPNAPAECTPVARFRTRKTALLLAYLALHASRHHGREELIELFWPDLDLPAARDNLSGCLSSLRRQFGASAGAESSAAPSLLDANRDAVWLNTVAVSTDVSEFERALDASADRQMPPVQRRTLLETAVALYRGPFLPDVYEEWALSQQTRLAQRYALALAALADAQETTGARDLALSTARRARQADPLHEAACLIEMRILARSGQSEAARRVYQDFAAYMERELGCQPSATLQAFTRRLDEIAQAEAPEREEAIPSHVEPQTPAASTIPGGSHIPVNLARFWGRTAEVESLVALIRDPVGPRLITITGPGGMGKTHLSLVVAAQLVAADPTLPVRWVPLADVSDDRLFIPAVQQALGGTTPGEGDPIPALIATLSAMSANASGAVLLLDNLEQLVGDDATLGRVPARIRLLLERIPGLKIVGTSRRILGLANEQEFPLGPLPLPSGESRAVLQAATRALAEMQEIPSVALFVERARLVRPDFALTLANAEAVAAICRRLEGLPLALEMAATWVRILSLPQMQERLETQVSALQSRRKDLPPRQRSLRATVEWSWELLDDDLRPFFLRLAVFRGGFTYAASQVAGADDPRTLDWLVRLQEHSLLIRRAEATEDADAEERYAFLEPVREWAVEKLSEDAEAWRDARRRHIAYFQDRGRTPAGLKPDMQNCVAALHELLRPNPDVEIEPVAVREGLRLTTSVAHYWYQHTQYTIAHQFLSQALARYRAVSLGTGIGDDPVSYARALHYIGTMAHNKGRWDEAERDLLEAQQRYAELGDNVRGAYCTTELGILYMELENHESSTRHLTRAVAMGRENNDPNIIGFGLGQLATTHTERGDWEAAHEAHRQALECYRAANNPGPCVSTLLNQALLAFRVNDLAAAWAYISEGFDIAATIENVRINSALLVMTAGLAARAGLTASAVRLLASADCVLEAEGLPMLPHEQGSRMQALGSEDWQSPLSASEIADAQELGRTNSNAEAIAYARQVGDSLGVHPKL